MTQKKYYIVVEYNAEFNVEVLALTDDLREFINKEEFKKHMKDAIDIRVQSYYRNRFVKNK